MMTAVGLSAPEVTASVRSATTRFTVTPIHDKRFEPFVLAEIPEDALPSLAAAVSGLSGLTSRVMRMLRLATMPLTEALAALPKRAPRPGLLLALPEGETTVPLDRNGFPALLAAQCPGAFDVKYSSAQYLGRAGGVSAIGQAAELVSSGQVPLMLAGGIDSYRDLFILGTLDMEGRVKSSSNLDGFVPGEGAAFVLLATRKSAKTYGLSPSAVVTPSADGFEPGHLYSEEIYRGDGLAQTLRNLGARGALSAPVTDVYSAMNGESHWGKEWGVAYVRNRAMFDEEHAIHHPADCHGDVGAAAGAVMAGLAAAGLSSGNLRGPAVLYGSSDRGARAALVVHHT